MLPAVKVLDFGSLAHTACLIDFCLFLCSLLDGVSVEGLIFSGKTMNIPQMHAIVEGPV